MYQMSAPSLNASPSADMSDHTRGHRSRNGWPGGTTLISPAVSICASSPCLNSATLLTIMRSEAAALPSWSLLASCSLDSWKRPESPIGVPPNSTRWQSHSGLPVPVSKRLPPIGRLPQMGMRRRGLPGALSCMIASLGRFSTHVSHWPSRPCPKTMSRALCRNWSRSKNRSATRAELGAAREQSTTPTATAGDAMAGDVLDPGVSRGGSK
mmetsp:Transcript_28365/g.66387  ORF Transcript_28365/g.66387 Transcript_28365/m.66387 type:complete len:211 (+) Transcript_28365:443-1075(+)